MVILARFGSAGEDSGGNVVTRTGRYSDVLVRIGGEWKFISWHGGDDPSG